MSPWSAQAGGEVKKSPRGWEQLDHLKPQGGGPLLPAMSTRCIGAGRKDKVRPGDILGALTGDAGIPGAQVGKIAIFDFQAYVAVERAIAKQALQRLNDGKIKGRPLRVRLLSNDLQSKEDPRSAVRRVGNECVRTGRYRWSPYLYIQTLS